MRHINTRQCPSECSLRLVGVSVLPLPLSLVRLSDDAIDLPTTRVMTLQTVNELKEDAIAAAQLVLRRVKDTSDVFPPLKSIAAMGVAIMDMSEVSLAYR
jgi:hypothetical protein